MSSENKERSGALTLAQFQNLSHQWPLVSCNLLGDHHATTPGCCCLLQLANQTRNGLYVLKRTSVFFKRLTEANELYTAELGRVTAETEPFCASQRVRRPGECD
jgi:hypothetical protein